VVAINESNNLGIYDIFPLVTGIRTGMFSVRCDCINVLRKVLWII